MKIQEITKEYVLFDNGKKLIYLIIYPEETSAYRYYVDLFALAPQLEGKELEEDVRICRPSRMVRSKEFDEGWEFTSGVNLQFGNCPKQYYLPLYKKANPEYSELDIQQVYWALDCTQTQINAPDFDRKSYDHTLAQLEQWKKDRKRRNKTSWPRNPHHHTIKEGIIERLRHSEYVEKRHHRGIKRQGGNDDKFPNAI